MSARHLRRPFFSTPCEITIQGSNYKIIRKLDNGSFGQVYVSHKLHDKNVLFAIKIMSLKIIKSGQQQLKIRQEINLHSQINNIGIVKVFAFDEHIKIKEKYYACMVMEYCEGSHLSQYMRYHPSDQLTEIESFYFFQQIIGSLECLHSQYIIHRDIKPQNLLLSNCKNFLPILKLCDFGLAKKLNETTQTTDSLCGTPNYVAPEIVRSEGHSYSADIWSAGIVLYIMLVKLHKPPFETGNVLKTMDKVRHCNVEIPKYLTKECQSFLSLIFIKNGAKRITIKQLKQHIWYRQNKRRLNILLKRGLNPINTANLRNYKKHFKNIGYIYEMDNGSAKLFWGGKQNDDYSLEVKKNGELKVIFGGISTKTYNINTIPIGFYEQYMMLHQFVMIQARNTPLIAVSVHDESDEKTDGFNTNHYASLVQSQHIDYYRVDKNNKKTQIFIQFNKYRNEYIGYYQNKTFNVLHTKLHKNDILLFQALKTELLGQLSSKYIDKTDNKVQYPVVLKYNLEKQQVYV